MTARREQVRFADRRDAGRRLAHELSRWRDHDVVVLGLPRGGVPVAYEVADALGAPLDVIVVRKLGVPLRPELAMGAIGEDGARVLNAGVLCAAGVESWEVAAVERVERAELARRVRRYREGRRRVPLAGRVAVLVDDGLATGASAITACRVARAQGARTVVLAVPVAAAEAVDVAAAAADELVYLSAPEDLGAVGDWYTDFRPTADDEVCDLLAAAAVRPGERLAGGVEHA
jgi:putative phosphoribosyl transferase